MAYHILRAKKLKTVGNVTGSLQHMLRENGKAPNVDKQRTKFNMNSVKSVAEAMQRFKELEPDYKQKNNVEAIEFLVTASPEFFQDEPKSIWQTYLQNGLAWIKDLIGTENIVASSFQMDEKTPHLSVIMRPIVKRKFKGNTVKTALAAKRYLDGSAMLSKMQDKFYADVSQEFGLERGIKGSLTKHQSMQSYYGEQSGSGRIRELEIENEKLLNILKKERKRFKEKLKTLVDEIEALQAEGGRWRKKATELSSTWFAEDIEKAETVKALRELEVELNKSEVLPRSTKANLNKIISKRSLELAPKPPTKTKSRRRG